MDDVFLQDDLGPTIAEHATQCQSLFNKYITMSDTVPDPTIMDDQLARFSLWTSNMYVYGLPNVSLDYRLRFSPTAADIIHQLLDLICDTLLSLKPIDQRPPRSPSRKRRRLSVHRASEVTGDDYPNDSDSDIDPEEGNLLKITETIGGTITRLFRLSNAIRRSAKANRARKIEMYTGDEEANKAIEELRLYTQSYIEFRFPEASETLRCALIEANALRLRRLYYQHSHRRRIDLTIQDPRPKPAPIIVPKIAESTPMVQFAQIPLPKPATGSRMPVPSPAPVTNATTARQTAVAALYAKSETDIPRAKSVLVNNKLSFPPVPPTQQCPYCGVIIESKNAPKSLLWQNHVIRDLEPFICIFPQCLEACHNGSSISPLTFETSKEWSSHMQTAHGHMWECRAPSHHPMVFEQEGEYQEHSIKEHDVPEAYAAALSNAAQRPILNKVLECPFGDDFQPPGNAEAGVIFSTEALESHVAGHMKEIALLSLQKLPTDSDENSESIDSDQPLEDEDTTGPFRVTRASMCSILDDELLDFTFNDDAEPFNFTINDDDDNGSDITDDNLEHRDKRIWDKDCEGQSAMHRAVQNDDIDLVIDLARSGRDLNSKDENGQTPLHYAVEGDLVECMDALLKRGADPRMTDNSGFSPALWAVIGGQVYLAEKMLSDEYRVTSADMDSALTWAARLGFIEIAEMIILRGGMLSGTHLQEAAASGQEDIVKLLIDKGYDPNYRNRGGRSAMHYAAEEGHLNIVKLLLDRGADPGAVSSQGKSPLHCAANGGHASIVSFILSKGLADTRTSEGWTAFHHAAYMGHSDVIQVLLEYDPDNASQQDNDGWSALHLAVLRQNSATIAILLASISEELKTETILAAEDWVQKRGLQKDQCDLALSKSRCCQAVTGLRRAVTSGSVPLVELLIDLGHNVNDTDSGNRTALYYAVKMSMLPMINLLITRGADIYILPLGWKAWEEVVSDHSVLRRLTAAGYKRPENSDDMVGLVRQEFISRKQQLVPGQSSASLSGESASPKLDQQKSGSFADDLEFAATLAAGLNDTGFNPDIIIDDPRYKRV